MLSITVFNKMLIIVGCISLFNSAFSAAQHLRTTAQEFTGLPLDIVVQAVTSLLVIISGVLNVAGNRREIQAAAELNQTTCETQCNLPSYSTVNHRGKAISAEHLSTNTKAELEKSVFMAAQEDKIKSLEEKNNVLVQENEHWKATDAQRESEKLELMRQHKELRQKVIRLQSDGAADALKLGTAVQCETEQALAYLVQASSAVVRTLELAKAHMRDREGPDVVSPRWSSISDSTEKVHRVPLMITGGQAIRAGVSLSRASLNFNTPSKGPSINHVMGFGHSQPPSPHSW